MRDPLTHEPVDNDPLGTAQTTERSTWGLPSDEGIAGQQPAELAPAGFDYSAGMLAGGESYDANAEPWLAHHQIRARSDAPTFDLPHEATHRRYEAPFTVALTQAAAGFTLIAPPRPGLHYLKLIACAITLDAAGTLKFVQGSTDGTATGDVSGAMPLATNGGFVLSPSEISTPWFFTAPDQALGVFTVTGKAFGFVTCVYSPYDQ